MKLSPLQRGLLTAIKGAVKTDREGTGACNDTVCSPSLSRNVCLRVLSVGLPAGKYALRRAAQSSDLGTSKRARQGVDD
jgi:hypothetical protein